MVEIPKQNLIQQALAQGEIENPIRPYLGMSMIGNGCMRYLQIYMRQAYSKTISKRIDRLFRAGDAFEPVFVKSLEEIGAIVTDDQLEVIGFAGHWKGHIDGKVINLPGCEKTMHLLEMKTHNEKSFNDVVKCGVRVSKPSHYAQMIRYMGALDLTRGLYGAMNKNTSEYYTERIYFDQEYYDELLHKEREIIFANTLYPRIGTGQSTWFECKFCDAREVCFGMKKPAKNCRTCKHVDILEEGKWSCGKGYELKLCDEYELAEILEIQND